MPQLFPNPNSITAPGNVSPQNQGAMGNPPPQNQGGIGNPPPPNQGGIGNPTPPNQGAQLTNSALPPQNPTPPAPPANSISTTAGNDNITGDSLVDTPQPKGVGILNSSTNL